MSDTPMTDAELDETMHDKRYISSAFARKLERDLNSRLVKNLWCINEACKMEKERDQWKAMAEKLAKCCHLQSRELGDELPPAVYEEWLMMVQEERKRDSSVPPTTH